jgi:hypothetical protein
VVEAEVKKRARLNVITHLLGQVPYEDLTPKAPDLPPRPADRGRLRASAQGEPAHHP